MALKKSYTRTGQVYYAKQPENWAIRLGKKVKAQFAKEKLTAEQKKAKEIQATRLSRPSKRQLSQLSESDYDAVMKILRGKKK